MSNIQKTFRELRESKGLSQEKLARLTDVANNTIIKIEVDQKITGYRKELGINSPFGESI